MLPRCYFDNMCYSNRTEVTLSMTQYRNECLTATDLEPNSTFSRTTTGAINEAGKHVCDELDLKATKMGFNGLHAEMHFGSLH